MLVLGIESSAHTFGVGVAENGKILSNERIMYNIGNKGLIPSKVAEFHAKNTNTVISAALKSAGIGIQDLEGVGYTKGPGLGPCLQIGELSAKTIAKKLGIEIAPVHHGVAHIEVTRAFSKLKDPIVLYVSGGNSQILKLTDTPYRHYQVLGETFDIGVGNMLDAFAREIKLMPAWGSTVERTAKNGRYVELPYTVKGMDFSFTGLLTSATKLKERISKEDLCFSMQEVSFSMLCEATERALLLNGKKELCVCGGVAQNERLKNMLASIAKEHRARFGYARNEFNADNGAMIAFVAERMLANKAAISLEKCEIQQRYRIDRAVVYE